ncbi:hypothetical protein DIPPA_14882 [Diplonema papillatum]|nr:hypothetical protein DIPPA_14882 [Diplonema papillatum]
MSDSQGPFLGAELSDYRRERYIWYMWEKYIRPGKWVAFGVGIGVGCTLLAGRQQSDSHLRLAAILRSVVGLLC